MSGRAPSAAELDALAQFAEELVVRCEDAQVEHNHSRDDPQFNTLKQLNRAIGKATRRLVSGGQLLAAAEHLCHPEYGCRCGLRFLAKAEPFLSPADVARLRSSSESTEELNGPQFSRALRPD